MDFEALPLVRRVENDKGANIGLLSDLHVSPNTNPQTVIDAISAEGERDILFLLGDIVDCTGTKSTAEQVKKVVTGLTKKHGKVVFTPGNHDLRNLKNPWQTYGELQNNRQVSMPLGNMPMIETIGGVRIMAANVFYDGTMLSDEHVRTLGYEPGHLPHFYKNQLRDGKTLFEGKRDLFKSYAYTAQANIAQATRKLDFVATHVPISPAAVYVRTPLPAQQTSSLRSHGVELCTNEEENMAKARSCGVPRDQFYRHSALGAYFIGSNILGPVQSERVQGAAHSKRFVSLFGHNHRRAHHHAVVNGQTIEFLSHQVENHPSLHPKKA